MKIISIVGARPQFIKAAVLSREIRKHSDLSELIIHTGQHYDKNMSDVFFEEMEIPTADFNLSINGLNHGAMTGQMLIGIEEILLKENPDIVIVFGDTNTTLAGALSAKKLHIKVAHIEAGLRSFNMRMPEEVNRILTDRISNLLFCPTQNAVDNLVKEGFKEFDSQIILSGDIMYDAVLYYSQKASEKSTIISELNLSEYFLSTIHRAENTDDLQRLKSIVAALNKLNEVTKVILPLHPRTKKIINQNQLKYDFTIIEPVGYFDMLELIRNSKLVLTDSGGLQKEAYFLGKNCVTLRDETEWVELVEDGFNILAGADAEKIIEYASVMKNKTSDFTKNLFGRGDAGSLIVKHLEDFLY